MKINNPGTVSINYYLDKKPSPLICNFESPFGHVIGADLYPLYMKIIFRQKHTILKSGFSKFSALRNDKDDFNLTSEIQLEDIKLNHGYIFRLAVLTKDYL